MIGRAAVGLVRGNCRPLPLVTAASRLLGHLGQNNVEACQPYADNHLKPLAGDR
jgi:hypothetical protein